MAIALVPILSLYSLFVAGFLLLLIGAALDRDAGGIASVVLVGALGAFTLYHHLGKSVTLTLRAARARELGYGERPELEALCRRVAAMADLPAPRVGITRSKTPNAFSTGQKHGRPFVVFTTGLLRLDLTQQELEAVVAHELAHVANRDALVMTFAGVPAMVGSLMYHHEDEVPRIMFAAFYWPIFVVSLFFVWTLSRYREYIADRGAALITGAPEQLMSALQKIAGTPPRGDLRGGLAVQALCIVGRKASWSRFELLSDHPPLEKRLARLSALSRELGKPV
jgi:heat shock protein HtpX